MGKFLPSLASGEDDQPLSADHLPTPRCSGLCIPLPTLAIILKSSWTSYSSLIPVYTHSTRVFSLGIFMTNISFKIPLATSEVMVSCCVFNPLSCQVHPKCSPIRSNLNFLGSDSGSLCVVSPYHFSLVFYCF